VFAVVYYSHYCGADGNATTVIEQVVTGVFFMHCQSSRRRVGQRCDQGSE
jgi:hypothetical protein